MNKPESQTERIVILIPCYNEEKTIGKVIEDFKTILPQGNILVFDNNSTDRTAEIARGKGAEVIREKRQGKGFVVNSMFDRIIADYYIMIDGDDTYPAEYAPQMIEILRREEADIVVANRMVSYQETRVRPFHGLGNKIVRWLVNLMYWVNLKDPMSGFRAFRYDAVMALPFLSPGFEIETEMTLAALYRRLVIKEIDVPYRDRPPESISKLNTVRDGIKVLFYIFLIFKAYKPMTFFGLLSILLFSTGLINGWVVIEEFIKTRNITHLPIAILTGILIIVGFTLGITGIIIHTINYRILEFNIVVAKHMKHLKKMISG